MGKNPGGWLSSATDVMCVHPIKQAKACTPIFHYSGVNKKGAMFAPFLLGNIGWI
jgi:hypothetical protein